jgi:hypothetical protein
VGPKQTPLQSAQGVISLGVKQKGREADHSPPSNTEDKNGGAMPPSSLCLHCTLLS